MSEELIVNGKHYPLWSQFIERKDEWIGGTLMDSGTKTKITNISLTPNGNDSAFFEVHGEDFGCGFDVEFGGIGGTPKMKNGLCMSGFGNLTFEIAQKPLSS